MQKGSTKIKPSLVFYKDHTYTHPLDSWQDSPYTLQGKPVLSEVDWFKI